MIDDIEIERAAVDFLRADAGVQAAVGTRLFEDDIPQNEKLPAVEISCGEQTEHETLDEPATEGTTKLVIDCYATDAGAARRTRKAIAAAVAAFEASAGTKWGTVGVQSARVVSRAGGKADVEWLQRKAFVKRLVVEVFHSV